jgi:hypothetical protein
MNSEWKYCPYCGNPIRECECDRDERFPVGYAEVEYSDFDNAEARDGARFDDLNYLHYLER